MTSSIKDNCDSWIKLAYEDWLSWLRDSNKKNSTYMRGSTRNMVDRMWACSSDLNRQEEAWNLLERLKRLGNNFTQLEDEFGTKSYLYEHAEIYLECALAAYNMGDLQEAISLFKISVAGFPNRTLHKAIGYWLYGCIQWQSQSHREDALISWEKSLQIVNDVKVDNNHDTAYSIKCEEIAQKAKLGIEGASINNYPPPVVPKTEPAKNEETQKKSKSNSAKQPSRPSSARLRIFPILGSIPAGPPSAAKDADWEHLDLEELEINGVFHTIHSLTREREIKIVPGKSYYLLQVDGHSMNTSDPVPLLSGDFVLMVEQKTADSGNIVAVEYEDGNVHVKTLKKYFKKDKSHIFEAQSDRKDIPPYFTLNNDFVIRGVALAVLKAS